MKSAAQIAAAKRNLAIARSKRVRRKLNKAQASKRKFHVSSRKKLNRKRGLVEYVDGSGRRTGLATTTASRTFSGAMRKAGRGGKFNKKYAKKVGKHNKKINKLKSKSVKYSAVGLN